MFKFSSLRTMSFAAFIKRVMCMCDTYAVRRPSQRKMQDYYFGGYTPREVLDELYAR